MTTTRSARRGAFTTIELLVVIAIIAVLVALTTAGVQRVRIAAQRAKAVSEIAQLSTAIQVFQRDKKVDYIPSRITLRERMNYDSANPVDVESANYLKRVWPQIPVSLSPGGATSPFGAGLGLDWNGNLALDVNPVTLEGDQCLVFFLGGIPRPQGNGTFGAGGFSNNPANPADLTSLKSPAFEFQATRLKDFRGTGFPSYVDAFGAQPYAYFSSYGTKTLSQTYNRFGGTDCPTAGLSPYIQTATPLGFWQPTGHQIVSAGVDKLFGVGGPTSNLSTGAPDGDNITNFSNGQVSSLN
jgi:type II secretory pathway pseudopilin PulG